MSSNLGIACRLADGGVQHRVRGVNLTLSVLDTLGRLKVIAGDRATLQWDGGSGDLIIDRETRLYAERNPDSLWIADISAEEGTLIPFSPPRSVRLDAQVPVKVPPELTERLEKIGFKIDNDLAHRGVVLARGKDAAMAIVGQRAVAALDEDDGLSVTWWLPQGTALELRVVVTGDRGYLELRDIVSQRDAHTANCGPNTLLSMGPKAALPLLKLTAPDTVPLSALEPFRPARAPLFDAWARYTLIERQEKEERARIRMAHPLQYRKARQRGSSWLAEVKMEADAERAWLGADAVEGRAVKAQQPVAQVSSDPPLGSFTLEEITLRGPGVADILVRPERNARVLPEEGVLEAREDKGEKKRREREREALDCLGQGRAACPSLLNLLGNPSFAMEPSAGRLLLPVADQLDPHQERAVQLMVGCKDIVAIQGPPGTGKTRVIVEAIRQIEAMHRDGARPVRVLISSVQNEAVGNVVERLALGGSLIVKLIRRDAKNDEEAFSYAQWSRQQGEDVIQKLERLLEKSEVASTLARVRDSEAEVQQIRDWLAVLARPSLVRSLRTLAANTESLIGAFHREEALSLAQQLEAPQAAPRPGGPEPLPGSMTEAERWWQRNAGVCPVDVKAAIAAAVQGLTEALAEPNPTRRELMTARRWKTLREVATTIPVSPVDAPVENVLARVESWVIGVLHELRRLRTAIEGRPEAVAQRFLEALREDPQAWSAIVERHGNAVAATCSMSAKAKLDPGEAYDWVIIDEAGRASPFELLVPMVQGRRIVLIGDHRQLPPTVDEAVIRRTEMEQSGGPDIRYETLFGSLFSLLPPGSKVRLAVQYRMHGVIGALVDELFYRPLGEELASEFSGVRANKRRLAWDVFGRRPLHWLEVAPDRECTEENHREAQAVVELLRVYAEAGADPGSVAVICPYSRQRELLRRLLGNEPSLLRIAQIKTIDAVQGREYPVVILCLVRTDRRAGFLASPNRLNVAISRAQRQLVVVGSAQRFLVPSIRDRAPQLYQLVDRLSKGRMEME